MRAQLFMAGMLAGVSLPLMPSAFEADAKTTHAAWMTSPPVPIPYMHLRAVETATITNQAITLAGDMHGFRKLDAIAARLGVPAVASGDLVMISASGKRYDVGALWTAMLDRMDAITTTQANRAGPRRTKPPGPRTPIAMPPVRFR